MFRPLVFSIVLTVVTSPSTAVLCRAWCSVQSATVNVCNHSTPTASTNVVADDTCDDVWIGAAAFVREDTGGASAEDGHRAVLVADYQSADIDTAAHCDRFAGLAADVAKEARSMATAHEGMAAKH